MTPEDDPTSCTGSRMVPDEFAFNFRMAIEWLPGEFGRGLHALVVHMSMHSTESSLS